MVMAMLGCVLLILAEVFLILGLVYDKLPAIELKKRARNGDEMAALLYRTMAYGFSVRLLMAALGIVAAYGAVQLLYIAFGPWLAPVAIILGAIFGYWVVRSNSGVRSIGLWLARLASPAIAWLAERLHPFIDPLARGLRRVFPKSVHSGIYDRSDLIELLERQKDQPDNRITPDELQLAQHALSFGEQQVSHHMVPRSKVISVNIEDDIGPITLGELHASGHGRFPVYEGANDVIVGLLFMTDAVGLKSGGKVRAVVRFGVRYIHEDASLYEALQACIKTKQQMLIVVNDDEEYVGILTIESIIASVFGEVPLQDTVAYEDKHSVARSRAPRRVSTPANKEKPADKKPVDA